MFIAVVLGYFGLFGPRDSTVSAHPIILAMAIPASPGRRRRGQTTDKRAAFYARFSSDLQDASSIEQQFRKCREAAEANGHLILPALEFRDDAISGTRGDRAGLNAML
ncbi:MAG: recombinase family protein, partial [Gemmataceae bacterium]|nr:recombinase family protein [Gemmataceae bacterium]